MEEIYKNSVCNIAATAVPDGRTGCFLQQNPLLARACRVEIKLPPNAYLRPNFYDLVPQLLWRDGVISAQLSQRPWVVQVHS
jgi:hypothetical protein